MAPDYVFRPMTSADLPLVRRWLAEPHVRAVGAAVPLEQPGLGTLPFPRLPGLGPWSVPAPALGEHTAEVLAEIGL